MSTYRTNFLLAIACPVIALASPGADGPPPSLKLAFQDAFLIGTALNRSQILDPDEQTLKLVRAQFNAVTAENATKWEKIQPHEGEFDWKAADALVAFAESHGMHVTGHVLVWHQQTPDWVFLDAEGTPATRDLLLARMKRHIEEVVGRYRGRIDAWEVVNEGLNEDGTLRQTPWLRIIGDDYIAKAFEFARRADPDANLYYNDFNLYKPAKRAGAARLVRDLQDRGIRVDGVGMQAHYGIEQPEDIAEFEDSIEAFAQLGVEVYLTELDVVVLPFPDAESFGADLSVRRELQAELNPYTEGLPPEIERRQADRYLDIFRILLEHQETVSRVTFWGVTDAQSWKNDWPIRGRTDYPLLFDRKGLPKPVFFEVIELAEGW